MQAKMTKLIGKQEATHEDITGFTSTMRNLENEMNKIELAGFQAYTRPLLIDDTIVEFRNVYKHDFGPLIFSSMCGSITYPENSWRSLATNNRLLMIYQAPNLCLLNTELNIVKQVPWSHGRISDICWSSTLARFIVIVKDEIFLINENTMSIEKMKTTEKQNWFSCTCFNDQLFLSIGAWGSSIVKINLSSPTNVVKEWKTPKTCTMDDWITDIVYNNEMLALLIQNKVEKSIRMELRSCQRLDCLWTFPLAVKYNERIAARFCSLGCNGWLVADFKNESLLRITAEGKMIQIIVYKSIPYRATLFSPNLLAIVAEKSVNFYRI